MTFEPFSFSHCQLNHGLLGKWGTGGGWGLREGGGANVNTIKPTKHHTVLPSDRMSHSLLQNPLLISAREVCEIPNENSYNDCFSKYQAT